MAIKDSSTGTVIRNYSLDALRDAANLMRGNCLVALCAAGSGHSGSSLSIMDIAAALYLNVADHDPRNPSWPDRDRIVWSAGHQARRSLRCAGNGRVLSAQRCSHAAQARFAVPGTSPLAQITGC